MSSATVRAQLKAFCEAGSITHVNRWYAAEPWYIAAQQLGMAAGGGVGAVAWPHIADEAEERITVGAPSPSLGLPASGQKQITYQVSFVMLYVFAIPSDPGSEDAYIGPLDDMIESLKVRLRSDPKAGTGVGLGGVIFEQSQAQGDLHVVRDVPMLDQQGGSLLVWQRIDTTVTEILTA